MPPSDRFYREPAKLLNTDALFMVKTEHLESELERRQGLSAKELAAERYIRRNFTSISKEDIDRIKLAFTAGADWATSYYSA